MFFDFYLQEINVPHSSAHYTGPVMYLSPDICLFPAHDTGLVMLQVAMGGEVISSSVVFEYKARDLPALPSSQHDWLSLDGESDYLHIDQIIVFVNSHHEPLYHMHSSPVI